MKLGCVTLCYHEPRLVVPFIQSMQDRVDEILVLNSTVPWQGEAEDEDKTASIAESLGVTVIRHDWPTEQTQRNAGQDYFHDKDWIIILDPDEYFITEDWDRLNLFLESAPLDAYVTGNQTTLWKRGYAIDPPEDYRQIVAVRPSVRFVDKRVVDTPWQYAPTNLWHASWARSDEEIWKKINHYSHAHEFDKLKWFSEVWQSNRLHDLHPLTPESLKKAVRVVLPQELDDLNIWP